jgi:hypothetical protein
MERIKEERIERSTFNVQRSTFIVQHPALDSQLSTLDQCSTFNSEATANECELTRILGGAGPAGFVSLGWLLADGFGGGLRLDVLETMPLRKFLGLPIGFGPIPGAAYTLFFGEHFLSNPMQFTDRCRFFFLFHNPSTSCGV